MAYGARAARTALGRIRQQAAHVVGGRAAPAGILSYHRVAEPVFDPWQLAVSAANFADQLAVLGASHRFVPLDHVDQLAGRPRQEPGRTPRLAVTFDDGYADNLHTALAILEHHDVPATVFVATGFLDRDAFWWDVLDAAVLDVGRPVTGLVAAARRAGLADGIGPDASRTELQARLHAALAASPPAAVEGLVADLVAADEVAPPVPCGRPLTSDELALLAAHPLVTLGVHTVHHVRLRMADAALARREIDEARCTLDRLTGRRPRPLAYPHGDTSPGVAALAVAAGFTCGVTTEHRWVGATDAPLLLPRLTVPDVSGAELARRLESARCR